MFRRMNPAVIRKLGYGLITVGLLIALSNSVADAQSYGQCTASVFVNQISLFPGGTGTGLAIDSQDNLYIASNANASGIFLLGSDSRAHVTKSTPEGTTSIVVPPGILGDVTGLAVDIEDNLYVADGNGNGNNGSTPRNMVWKVTPQGNISSFISGINNPTGLAFDSAQNLYVASFADRAVYKYSATGAFLGVVTIGLPDSPYGIAIDESGNLFVAGFGINGTDASGTRIYEVTPQGQRSVFVDPGFPDPYSLVFDNQGYLYASYYNSLKILRIAPNGLYTVFPGGCSGDDAANGLAIDSHGFLYASVNGQRTTGPPAVLKLSAVIPPPYDPNLDTTPPLLTVPGNMNVTASSSLGAIVNYIAIGTDEYYLPAPTACSTPSDSLFPIGTTPVTCVATDAAGNMSAPQTFNINVALGPIYGQCTATIFVNQISLYGGMAAGLAFDAQDNLYIAENVNNWGIIPQGPLVSKVTPQGVKSIFVAQGILGDVTALAFDSQGNLYVADGNGLGSEQPPANNIVWKVDQQGNATPFISAINNPTGLAFDAAHNLYVASYDDHAVYKFSATGIFLGVATSGLPQAPYGIAIDSAGNLFVAGFGSADGSRIFKVTPAGQQSIFVDPGIGEPHSLVFDRIGNLYASYYNSLKILRIAADGSFVTFPGGCSDDDAANGLAIDQHGGLYTAVNGGRTTDYPAVVKLFGIVPEQFGICPLYDQTRSVKAGATFPIKLELCDGNGNDLSSPSITVHAIAITKLSSVSGTPESPGNANPDNSFRFDSSLGAGGGYIFNLTTAGLSSGTYSLQFTVTGDPVTHSVNFGVK